MQQGGGGFVLEQRHADYASPPGNHVFRAHDRIECVVGSFDQDVRFQAANQLERRLLSENDDAIDRRERRDHASALRVGDDRPLWTLSQPARVTACAGMDAIAHALETAVTTKRNALSSMYSREAFKLCVKAFAEVLTHPKDLEARGRMLLGAAWGGMAIENSMLGGAHAAANPVTAHFGLAHGQAVGLMLPHVIRFNAHQPESRKIYIELGVVADLTSGGYDPASQMLVERIETLLDLAQIPRQLRDSNGERKMIPRLAEEAALQWTAKFNPRPLSKQDFVQLYEAAFGDQSGVSPRS